MGSPFGTDRCKKMRFGKKPQNCPKTATRVIQGNAVLEVWGPYTKRTDSRQRTVRELRSRWGGSDTLLVPEGTVADIINTKLVLPLLLLVVLLFVSLVLLLVLLYYSMIIILYSYMIIIL